ncbi:hypothetical protein M9Y10_007799 [Tritrichomonas musculus]|uniref:Protein kinase domain-containing protein n=1 Tax=Tritrichomonas musculus TaxID=1915356 RepID=A0ABR2J2C7_9EUKA
MSKRNIELQDFLVFIELLKDDKFTFESDTIKDIIHSFDVDVINNSHYEINSKFNLNITNPKIIIINQINLFDQSHNKDIIYSIVVFENTLIILDENGLNKFLSTNPHIPVLFLQKIGNIPKISNEINNDSIFQEENENLKKEFEIKERNKTFKYIWLLIAPCIVGYLIKKAYFKTKKDRFSNQKQDSDKITIYRKDFVVLRNIGFGSLFKVDLIYHLEKGELMAIKTQNGFDKNIQKYIKRETENYSILNHPLLPKFYNSPEGENYLVMEFINGLTLDKIDQIQLNDNEVVTIIFELIVIVEYLHSKIMIYRDLKPNNIIIDEYKNVVLIDFDRLIEDDPNKDQSTDFGTSYAWIDTQSGCFTERSDIYSLCKIIEYIIDKKLTSNTCLKQIIINIIRSCDDPNPDIPVAHFVAGYFYHKGDYIKKDIRKAIHYYKEGSSFNDQYAKNNLAIIYKNGYGDEIQANTANAIVYLEEAIRQKNDILSMHNLANIYIYDESYENKIDEAIELLFNSFDQFRHSCILLCLALIKKYDFQTKEIEKHVRKLNSKKPKAALSSLFSALHLLQSKDDFTNYYESYRDKYFLYNHLWKFVSFSEFQKQKRINMNHKNIPDINSAFYEGFGIEI